MRMVKTTIEQFMFRVWAWTWESHCICTMRRMANMTYAN
jgi:hypothetical protein